MNNDQRLLSEFQERNMGGVHHFNMFMGKGGTNFPLGVIRNEYRDVTSAWFLDNGKRTFLDLPKLVHVETRRATLNGGPCYVWSLPDLVPRYRVLLNFREKAVFDGYVYALSSDKAVAKARFCLSQRERIPIESLSAWLRDNPASVTTSRIEFTRT